MVSIFGFPGMHLPGISGIWSAGGSWHSLPSPGGDAAATPLKDTLVSMGAGLSSWQRAAWGEETHPCVLQLGQNALGAAIPNAHEWRQGTASPSVPVSCLILETWKPLGPGNAHVQRPCSVVERDLALRSEVLV